MLTHDQIHGMTNEQAKAHNDRIFAEHEAWEKRQKQGYVYFLRAGNTVKIGFSKNLRGRQEKLRNGNAYPVFICKFVKGTRATERAYHKRYAEWFDLRGRLAKYLEMHFRPVDLPDPANDPEPEMDIVL